MWRQGEPEEEELRGLLEAAALQIYSGLQAYLGDSSQCDALSLTLEGAACVWTAAGFVAAAAASLSLEHDFAPYLHTVPAAVAEPYRPLLTFLGVGASSPWLSCPPTCSCALSGALSSWSAGMTTSKTGAEAALCEITLARDVQHAVLGT